MRMGVHDYLYWKEYYNFSRKKKGEKIFDLMKNDVGK